MVSGRHKTRPEACSAKTEFTKLSGQKADTSAREILDTIVLTLESFRQNLEPEDDITLVVIKVAE